MLLFVLFNSWCQYHLFLNIMSFAVVVKDCCRFSNSSVVWTLLLIREFQTEDFVLDNTATRHTFFPGIQHFRRWLVFTDRVFPQCWRGGGGVNSMSVRASVSKETQKTVGRTSPSCCRLSPILLTFWQANTWLLSCDSPSYWQLIAAFSSPAMMMIIIIIKIASHCCR